MVWKQTFWTLGVTATFALATALSGCGGGGSSSSSSTPASLSEGIALPSEVSAVPADSGGGEEASLRAALSSLAAAVAVPEDSDYNQSITAKYVDEPTLEVFGIIETILKAMAQTNYADAENLGAGPYKTIVAWFEEEDGKAVKELEEWIVQSEMADGVNNVKVWINDPEEPVKVNVNIYTATEQDSEGNYVNYGEWDIHASFGNGVDFGGEFYADATIDESGKTVLRLSEDISETEGFGGQPITLNNNTKAVMYKSPTTGYGVAQIADWDTCWESIDWQSGEDESDSICVTDAVDGEYTLPAETAQYAYTSGYLALRTLDKDGNPGPATYKDRSEEAKVEIAYRYGLFDSDGTNVEKLNQFGFPITYVEDGVTHHGYYGAWQGRHQLWAGGEQTLPDGTTVTEEVWDDETPAEDFTTKTYQGAMTKRTLANGDLAQIQDIPVEIWLSDNFDLQYDSALEGWKKCTWEDTGEVNEWGPIWEQTCSESAFNLESLVNDEESRKWVNIGGQECDEEFNCTYHQYEYDQANSYFVETEWSSSPGTVYDSAAWQEGDRLWVGVGGSTYIVYDGDFTGGKTGWVEKTMESFDEQTWTPVFVEDGDVTFDFPADREYYVNNKGANFVVRRVAQNDNADDYEVKMEEQTVVRPDNVATLISEGTYFAFQWEDADTRSTYEFNPDTMMLVYKTVGQNDDDASIGDTLERGSWGLVAYDSVGAAIENGDGSPVQFNWEYATEQNPWGAVTYLIQEDESPLYLDDPIFLDPEELTTLGGDQITFSLQFDGWLHGLPDMRWELEKNDFVLTDAIKDKVVNIPAGEDFTSGTDTYYMKPLEVGVILPTLESAPAENAPDLGQATGINLDDFTVPDFTDIGDLPTGVNLKYVEGKPAAE